MKQGILLTQSVDVTVAASATEYDVFAALAAAHYWIIHRVEISADLALKYQLHFDTSVASKNMISAGFLPANGGAVVSLSEGKEIWSKDSNNAPLAACKIRIIGTVAASTVVRVTIDYQDYV